MYLINLYLFSIYALIIKFVSTASLQSSHESPYSVNDSVKSTDNTSVNSFNMELDQIYPLHPSPFENDHVFGNEKKRSEMETVMTTSNPQLEEQKLCSNLKLESTKNIFHPSVNPLQHSISTGSSDQLQRFRFESNETGNKNKDDDDDENFIEALIKSLASPSEKNIHLISAFSVDPSESSKDIVDPPKLLIFGLRLRDEDIHVLESFLKRKIPFSSTSKEGLNLHMRNMKEIIHFEQSGIIPASNSIKSYQQCDFFQCATYGVVALSAVVASYQILVKGESDIKFSFLCWYSN